MTPLNAETQPVPDDDMDEWPLWPPGLSPEALHELNKTRYVIGDVYQKANQSAGTNLSRHQWTAGFVAIFGTYAVLAAIVQLYNPKLKGPAGVEIAATGIAAGAVFAGLLWKFMKRWLVERHCAERCRFLKFDFLLHVALGGREEGSLLSTATRIQGEANHLRGLEEDELERWLVQERILQDPPPAAETEIVLSDLRVLAEHYLRTRLAAQSHYLSQQSHRDKGRSGRTGNVTALLFAASICIVFIHSLIEHSEEYASSSRLLILLAAAFPVIGAGVRAARAISEYSRNALRFEAKYNALNCVIEDVNKELSRQPTAQGVTRLLWKGEQILEGEHREWLRLMKETEWIG